MFPWHPHMMPPNEGQVFKYIVYRDISYSKDHAMTWRRGYQANLYVVFFFLFLFFLLEMLSILEIAGWDKELKA